MSYRIYLFWGDCTMKFGVNFAVVCIVVAFAIKILLNLPDTNCIGHFSVIS